MGLDKWRSEQAIIDALVDAVDAGDSEAKRKCAQILLEGYEHHDWHRRRIVDSGGILLNADLRAEVVDRDYLMGVLDERRFAEVEVGAALTIEEMSAWHNCLRSRAFDAELLFYGRGNACVILELRHSDRRRAYLAAMRWHERSGDFVAAFRTSTEALNALKAIGEVRMDSTLALDGQFGRKT